MDSPAPVILIATTNQGKLREVRQVLAGVGVALRSLADLPQMPEAVEDGPTFEANARIKAEHYAKLAGMWVLADDSGLEVEALNGAPGVHSARYAGPTRDDQANNAKLIEALKDVPPKQRTARFRCAIALATPTEVVAVVHGTVEGLIIENAQGRNGFGYDPHFLVPALNLTTAQMPPRQKNQISHRGQALRRIAPVIRKHVLSHT